jgi:hypothetical protein
MGKNALIILLLLSLFMTAWVINPTDASLKDDHGSIKPANIIQIGSLHFTVKDNNLIEQHLHSSFFNRRDDIVQFYNYSNITNPDCFAGYLIQSSDNIRSFYLNDSLLYILLDYDEPHYSTGFEIVDISNISDPIYQGHFIANDSYGWWHDPRENGHEILKFQDNYVFLANGPKSDYMKWIRIIDCSNLTAPVEVGRYEVSSYRINNFVLDDDLMYVLTFDEYVDIVDISDVNNPTNISSFDVSDSLDIKMHGDYLYFYGSQTSIFNVTDRLNPQFISEFADNNNYITELLFTEDYIITILSDNIVFYNNSNLINFELIANYTIDDSLVEDYSSGFFWGKEDNNRLYLARQSSNPGMTLYILDLADIANITYYVPYYTPPTTPKFAIEFGILLIWLSCIAIIQLLVRKISRKRKW